MDGKALFWTTLGMATRTCGSTVRLIQLADDGHDG